MTPSRTPRAAVPLPALAAALIYPPTLDASLVRDGATLTRPDALAAPRGPLPFSTNDFRPLGVWTLAVEASLVGGVDGIATWAFHLGNTLLRALNTAPVAALLAALALLYGPHPALVEGVAFASSRFDLLCTGALLAALLAAARSRGVAPNMGAVAEAAGDPSTAQAAFTCASLLDPNWPPPQERLATLMAGSTPAEGAP